MYCNISTKRYGPEAMDTREEFVIKESGEAVAFCASVVIRIV